MLLLLFSWLSVLASARAILSAREGCSEDHCPARLQGSSLVEKGELGRLSNIAHLSGRAGGSRIVPSAFKHEIFVEVEKRKSPGSSSSNKPSTSPDSPSNSDNDDDTNTGGGLSLDSPINNDPSATPADPGAGLSLDSPINNDPGATLADPGAGLNPFVTGPSPDPAPVTANPSVASPDPTAAGSAVSSVSAVAPTDTPSSPSPNGITKEEAEARFCPSTPGGLRPRGCSSSRPDGDDGANSDNPARVVQNPDALPQPVAPAVDRTTVNDWYDVIQQDPKPLFRAKEALDARIAGTGQDKPVADLTGKYFPEPGETANNMLGQGDMKPISEMWTALGRTTPGRSQRIYITPETNRETIVHEADIAEDGSFIGALTSYRDQDPLKDSPDRIEWSELMFHQLNEISRGSVSALSAVARVSIVTGKATDTTIKTALTRTGRTTNEPKEVVTFRADAPAGSEETLAFEALSRTDNVNGVLFLLADHFDAIGRKTVTAINVARSSKSSKSQAFHMVIDIA